MTQDTSDAYLENWDWRDEQKKAEFMEDLYQFYGKGDSLFTGLWLEFKEDLAQHARRKVTNGLCKIEDLFKAE